MTFKILTIFPDMVDKVLGESIIGRARRAGLIRAEALDIRPFSKHKHKNTDDAPFGGGAGMLMLAQPIVDAVEYAMGDNFSGKRLYLSPRGRALTQEKAEALSKENALILLCGHYEGVDQRAIDLVIDEEISVGDYVLTGGELGALIIVDAVARLIPGVLGSIESGVDESFTSGLLEYPQYTRPREFRGLAVPDVLLNGDHAQIVKWRREQALKLTLQRRPEMLNTAKLSYGDKAYINALKREREAKRMLKIGFIDYYLDEWHANNYPKWIQEAARELGVEFKVAYAWEDITRAGGVSGREWCQRHGAELLSTRQEVVDRSDVIVVLSPDDAGEHERLSDEALRSGKPVYVDKTFAPDLAAARRMFALAERHGTRLCSTSALRCARALDKLKGDPEIRHFATTGPGALDNYAVHQIEMIVSVMGAPAKRVLMMGGKHSGSALIDFGKGRYASFAQMPHFEFVCDAVWADGRSERVVPEDFFPNFILDMLRFFLGGAPVAPEDETLMVIAILDAAIEAHAKPGEWVRVSV